MVPAITKLGEGVCWLRTGRLWASRHCTRAARSPVRRAGRAGRDGGTVALEKRATGTGSQSGSRSRTSPRLHRVRAKRCSRCANWNPRRATADRYFFRCLVPPSSGGGRAVHGLKPAGDLGLAIPPPGRGDRRRNTGAPVLDAAEKASPALHGGACRVTSLRATWRPAEPTSRSTCRSSLRHEAVRDPRRRQQRVNDSDTGDEAAAEHENDAPGAPRSRGTDSGWLRQLDLSSGTKPADTRDQRMRINWLVTPPSSKPATSFAGSTGTGS